MASKGVGLLLLAARAGAASLRGPDFAAALTADADEMSVEFASAKIAQLPSREVQTNSSFAELAASSAHRRGPDNFAAALTSDADEMSAEFGTAKIAALPSRGTNASFAELAVGAGHRRGPDNFAAALTSDADEMSAEFGTAKIAALPSRGANASFAELAVGGGHRRGPDNFAAALTSDADEMSAEFGTAKIAGLPSRATQDNASFAEIATSADTTRLRGPEGFAGNLASGAEEMSAEFNSDKLEVGTAKLSAEFERLHKEASRQATELPRTMALCKALCPAYYPPFCPWTGKCQAEMYACGDHGTKADVAKCEDSISDQYRAIARR